MNCPFWGRKQGPTRQPWQICAPCKQPFGRGSKVDTESTWHGLPVDLVDRERLRYLQSMSMHRSQDVIHKIEPCVMPLLERHAADHPVADEEIERWGSHEKALGEKTGIFVTSLMMTRRANLQQLRPLGESCGTTPVAPTPAEPDLDEEEPEFRDLASQAISAQRNGCW